MKVKYQSKYNNNLIQVCKYKDEGTMIYLFKLLLLCVRPVFSAPLVQAQVDIKVLNLFSFYIYFLP